MGPGGAVVSESNIWGYWFDKWDRVVLWFQRVISVISEVIGLTNGTGWCCGFRVGRVVLWFQVLWFQREYEVIGLTNGTGWYCGFREEVIGLTNGTGWCCGFR